MALSYEKKGYGSAYPAMKKGGMVKSDAAACMKKGGAVKKKSKPKMPKKEK